MIQAFRRYRSLPSRLGHVLELGCGPFTQLKGILQQTGREWEVDSVTLADPILVCYLLLIHLLSLTHLGAWPLLI